MEEKSRRNGRPAHSDTMGVLPLRVIGSLEGVDDAFRDKDVEGIGYAMDGKYPMSMMGYFQKTAREQATDHSSKMNGRSLHRRGFTKEWVSKVLEEATSKDYEHLVNTLRKHMLEV